MSISRKHFHTFDALRFFSFLLVFVNHVPYEDSTLLPFFTQSGRVGVAFFFVLSGFLITYILLHEKITEGQLSLKKFFMRRILRIWPLFYAMILFAFLTPYILDALHLSYSGEGYKPNWLVSVLFLENYKMMLTHSFPDTSPLRVMWSLCIEEHFYILWGITFYFIPLKRVPHLIAISILTGIVFRLIYGHFGILYLDVFSNLDYFAYGAIPAYLLLFKGDLIDRVGEVSLSVKYFMLFITVALLFVIPCFNPGWMSSYQAVVLGILFALIILFTLPTAKPIHINDRWVISKLGIYTYGLYLFHTIIVNLLLRIGKDIPLMSNWFVLALVSLLLSVFVSIPSYYLFEKQFLKLKKYFY